MLTVASWLLLPLGAACGMTSGASSTEADAGVEAGGGGGGGGGTGGGGGGGGTGGGATAADGDVADDDGGLAAEGGAHVAPVNLRSAGAFVLLSKGGIAVVPTAAIKGDLGVSPAAATYITGCSLTADPSNVFLTSAQVTGKVYAADYALPTPPKLTLAIGDMELATLDAASRAPDFVELGAGDLTGRKLVPGVYRWSSAVILPTSVTLAGSASDVWIFQIAQTLSMSDATRIVLTGGALARNVFWQVSGSVDLGTTAHLEGNLLSESSITLGVGASLTGRLLAQTSISIGAGAALTAAP